MEAASRKSKILCCVVEQYIHTAEPIGSKQLIERSGIKVSSATVRNEMAALDEAGFLQQPHTSAGRVPTQEGYRHYLDVAAVPIQPTDKEKAVVVRQLSLSADDPEHILDSAAKVMSQMCACASVATTPPPEAVKIAKLRIVQTSRQTAMSVLVTSGGMVKYRLFRCDYMLTTELVKVFERLLNERLTGLAPEEVTPAFVQSMAAGFGELAMLMPTVLAAIMEQCSEINSMDARKHGESNLLFCSDFQLEDLRGIIKLLNSHEALAHLLLRADIRGGALLGTETGVSELYKCAVMARRYSVGSRPSGALGIITPLRNDYRKNIGMLEFVSGAVGNLINRLLET